MDHVSHPRRLALATVVLGATLGLAAPQWVSATPGPSASDAASTVPARAVSADAAAGPAVDALPVSDVAVAVRLPAPAVAEVAPPAAAAVHVAAPPAPVEVPVELPAVVTAPPAEPPAAPADQDDEATTGSLTVHVATQDGTTRTVWLQTPDRQPVGEPAAVTGDPVSFTDLEPGGYELFVEQVADEGGSMITRTVVTVGAGEDVVVSCDAETLDCTR